MSTLQNSCACSNAACTDSTTLLPETIDKSAAVFKAMGHPTRLTILEALKNGERCVCELAELVPGDLSTVSRHLSLLKTTGLITDRRQGQNIYYRLHLECVSSFISCIAGKVNPQDQDGTVCL